jgi:hypothetical protein
MSKVTVEQLIKAIGVPKNDPKIEKIRQIKQKTHLYGKDEALIKLLWYQAKRDALLEKMKQFNLTMPPGTKRDDVIQEALDYLGQKILESIRDFKSYPVDKEAFQVFLKKVMSHSRQYGPFLTTEYVIKTAQGLEKTFVDSAKDFFDLWSEFNIYDQDDKTDLDLEYLKNIYDRIQKIQSTQKPVLNEIDKLKLYISKTLSSAESFLKNLKSNNLAEIEEVLKLELFSPLVPGHKLEAFRLKSTIDHLRSIKNSPEFNAWLTAPEKKCRMLAEKAANE